ncbi:MAG: tRNA uridine-5-carboxymethylaminomethyl(34) synthesis GTPase MnmE [Gemmatimonadetes bacterium]|nr:tRNA uridine-5-carboxymethylaminomethyl(34) synthesis GTPase MnmE [Gemmatimonadota bacterium]
MADTIAAIATATGEGGLALLRVSGPEAVAVAAGCVRTRTPLEGVPTHTVHHGWARDAAGRRLDEVLVTVMRGPRSYTGEDVVEIGVHGGSVSARRVLRTLLESGARLAERGEFTRRAYVNGRMDLSQAEAVIDLIRARTERAADSALAGLAGGVAARTLAVESRLVDLLARIEVNLDFNEDVEAVGADVVGATLRECIAELDELQRRAPWGRRLREGATVVLVGRPNVGKSSIFNALLADERALVSPTPGTTRDWIEAWIDVDGIPVRLVDTAGMRVTKDDIESEGVRRTLQREHEADLRLVVLAVAETGNENTNEVRNDVDNDADKNTRDETHHEEDLRILSRTEKRPRIIVRNKTDLSERARSDPSELRVSARTGDGIAALREAIARELDAGVGRSPGDDVVPGERHADAIRRAAASLELARGSWKAGRTEELLAGDVRDALTALGEITGKSVGEAVLDRIFAGFCIGK